MVYVEPLAPEHGQPWSRLRADSPDELHRFAAQHQLTAGYQPNPADPDSGVYLLTAADRERAIGAGAAEATWLQVHERLRDVLPPASAPPRRRRTAGTAAVGLAAVLAVVGLVGAFVVVGVVALSGRATPAAAGPASVRSVETARAEIDQVAGSVTPGRVFAHEQSARVACQHGDGTRGLLHSTVNDPNSIQDAAAVIDTLRARGWVDTTGSVTPSTGKYDGTASSPDGHVRISVFASGSGAAPAFIDLSTTVEC